PVTTNTYDGLGRVTQVTLPDGQILSSTFSGNATAGASDFGNITVVTDQVGRQRKSVADGLGRMIKVFEQNPSTSNPVLLNLETDYTYDTIGNLILVNQGGQTRSFTYDALSRISGSITPEAGSVTYPSYNSFDLALSRIDARGVETDYTYDGLNRLSTIAYKSVPSSVATTTGVTIAYNTSAPGNGQIHSVNDGGGTETYQYDTLGRLTNKSRTIAVDQYTTSYTYNQANQLATITYPSQKVFRMDYDARGRLQGEDKLDSSGGVATNYASSIAYNSAQQVTGLMLGNGVAESYTYDTNRLQLTEQKSTKGTSTLMDLTYNYQAAAGASGAGTSPGNSGQLMSITGTVGLLANNSRNQSFTYDNEGRLVTATGSNWNRRYAYDVWGNRTGEWDATAGGNQLQSISLAPQTQPSVTGFPSNQIASVSANGVQSTYTYDASGNVTSDGAHSYTYDTEGRLAKVDAGSPSESDYSYDANNWRVKKVTNFNGSATTTYYVWDSGRVIAEYSTAPVTNTVPVKYYHPDRLSTRAITDSTGAVIGTEDTLPFGEEAGTSVGASEKHRFTSYERDSETGNDYAVNRHYANAVGKFMQPDPVGGSPGAPQTLNRYAYSMSDPINMWDPLGLAHTDGLGYWVGDFDGEFDPKQGLTWHADTESWGDPQNSNPQIDISPNPLSDNSVIDGSDADLDGRFQLLRRTNPEVLFLIPGWAPYRSFSLTRQELIGWRDETFKSCVESAYSALSGNGADYAQFVKFVGKKAAFTIVGQVAKQGATELVASGVVGEGTFIGKGLIKFGESSVVGPFSIGVLYLQLSASMAPTEAQMQRDRDFAHARGQAYEACQKATTASFGF
ncbi:MAG TPA: RHS repeat-associated core domain-containing protein, partial [Blastocatellia bacterium]|nr:RHS repeat-associated core domain-containing protein [Blastocatellia bacterium]